MSVFFDLFLQYAFWKVLCNSIKIDKTKYLSMMIVFIYFLTQIS